MRKNSEYEKAIRLRTAGKTYNEILNEVRVAKSTLSLWLRSVGLSLPQKQRITERRKAAQRKGAEARHSARLTEERDYITNGTRDVRGISARELWLVGIALYWAEGSKQNSSSVSAGLQFANSDARMLRVFLHWLNALKISRSDIGFDLYVHDNRKDEVEAFRTWWARELGVPREKLQNVYFKKDKPKTNRTNTTDLYHGLLRIKVKSSTSLNRQISGWIAGIVHHCRIV